MSSRQAVSVTHAMAMPETAPAMKILFLNFSHLFRVQPFQEVASFPQIEFRVIGLDTQKESIDGGAFGKGWDVKNRVIRHRQFVHRQHAESGTERCQQNSAFKRDGD